MLAVKMNENTMPKTRRRNVRFHDLLLCRAIGLIRPLLGTAPVPALPAMVSRLQRRLDTDPLFFSFSPDLRLAQTRVRCPPVGCPPAALLQLPKERALASRSPRGFGWRSLGLAGLHRQ
jgi:hypothetical protein